MAQIGRRIYYDKVTGNKIIDTGELLYGGIETTIERDILVFKELSERNRDTFDVLELPYGTDKESFSKCKTYRIDPYTKEVLFTFPDPNSPTGETAPSPSLESRVSALEETTNAMLGL